MFNKLDDADCVAKKMELPALNDGGDRSSVNQPFVLCCRSQANVPVERLQTTFASNQNL
jgi:hypothetical protein